MNHELPDVQADFRESRGTRDQIAKIHWIIEKAKQKRSLKNIYICFIDCAKAFDCESLPQKSMQRNKGTEWERLEISSRKLEIPREHFMQR